MKIGTKSILFGVHQFMLHPLFVLWAWWIIYREWPKKHELVAIITHDLGYWGSPNMDGPEGECHPARAARMFSNYTDFGHLVRCEIWGHSRFWAGAEGVRLSKLFQADKLSAALYPRWLYLLLANLSGEVHEYMVHAESGKYLDLIRSGKTQMQWLIETQSHMALMGLHGGDYEPVKKQMAEDRNAMSARP